MDVTIVNEHPNHTVECDRLVEAVRRVLGDSPFRQGEVNIAVVDDATIHALNRRYLDHDYPTDALSFVLEQSGDSLDGQIVVSADTAAAMAGEYGATLEDELLLYVVHAALHLVGYDDTSDREAARMRAAQRRYLSELGVEQIRQPAAANDLSASACRAEPPGGTEAP